MEFTFIWEHSDGVLLGDCTHVNCIEVPAPHLRGKVIPGTSFLLCRRAYLVWEWWIYEGQRMMRSHSGLQMQGLSWKRLRATNGRRAVCGCGLMERGCWCHSCLSMTHEYSDIWFATVQGLKIQCWTDKREWVFWEIKFCGYAQAMFFPPEALCFRPCFAGDCWQTVLKKQHSAPSSWTLRTVGNILGYWCHTVCNILHENQTIYLSVRERKSKVHWDHTLLLQDCCNQPSRKDHMCNGNAMWTNWNAHKSSVYT